MPTGCRNTPERDLNREEHLGHFTVMVMAGRMDKESAPVVDELSAVQSSRDSISENYVLSRKVSLKHCPAEPK